MILHCEENIARGYMERETRIAATMERVVATARQAADIIYET